MPVGWADIGGSGSPAIVALWFAWWYLSPPETEQGVHPT